jgi:hypothetical protein
VFGLTLQSAGFAFGDTPVQCVLDLRLKLLVAQGIVTVGRLADLLH